MEQKQQLKLLRRQMNPVGLTLLAYYGIMNAAVTMAMLVDMIVYLITNFNSWNLDMLLAHIMEFATSNGWGYLLAMLAGGLIALAWKGAVFWKDAIFAKGKPMTVGKFLQLLCVFISTQTVLQIVAPLIEMFFNLFGLSATAALEMASINTTGFSMFLYVSILGPVAEELLFRGLVLQILKPYGKQFAIFASAILFALFHGNVIQIPFAFLVGLVLGYVTVEHSIIWAVVLHIFNNFVLSDLMQRLTDILPAGAGDVLMYAILVIAAIATVIILILRRKEVKAYFQENRMDSLPLKAFFSTPCVLIFAILMLLSSLLTLTAL